MIYGWYLKLMNVARESDGLLDAGQVHALLDLIIRISESPTSEQLARELRVCVAASTAKTFNTVEMLQKLGLLKKDANGAVRLHEIRKGWSFTDWSAEIAHSTAQELAERLVARGPIGCLQRAGATRELWLDSMSLPGSHDGLSFWAIEFGAAHREFSTSRLWRVNEKFEPIFLDAARRFNFKKPKRPISPDQLAAQQELNAANGLLAEEWVLSQERIRLKDHPLQDQIRRISEEDIAAGFDILSFSSENSLHHDLHIEVKSYVEHCRFFWSSNEIETARVLGERYSLYLVDRSKMTNTGYAPQVIRGPYSAMLETGLPGWSINSDGYVCHGPSISNPDE